MTAALHERRGPFRPAPRHIILDANGDVLAVVARVAGNTEEDAQLDAHAVCQALNAWPSAARAVATVRDVIARARHTGEPIDPEVLARAIWGDR